MKKLLFIAMLLPAAMWAQKNNATKPAASAAAKNSNTVTLTCRLYGTKESADSVYVYENYGFAKKIVARAGKSGPDSAYVLNVPAAAGRYYAVGANEQFTAKVILGEEPQVTLWGNTQYMNKARTVSSPANKMLEDFQARLTAWAEESVQIRAQFNQSTGTMRRSMEERMAQFAARKTSYLDSLKKANPLLWRSAVLQLTPDYMGKGGTEIEYYIKSYFDYADLNDKGYEKMPDIYYAFESYTSFLINMGVKSEQLVQAAEIQLAKIQVNSFNYRMAFAGIIASLKANNVPQYPTMAKKYIETYQKNNLGEIPAMEMELRKASTFLTGFEAPDLAGMTPDSSQFSLKKLRGKVVLIDFWASWCGPCRKENPNVVANYQKYHEKGFDVLGVSLDREVNAWRNAIKQDGLPWHHISDLKGWQSAHAALYSVSSIPQTVLVDREGKILARNLRGEQLAQKLKEIFGE